MGISAHQLTSILWMIYLRTITANTPLFGTETAGRDLHIQVPGIIRSLNQRTLLESQMQKDSGLNHMDFALGNGTEILQWVLQECMLRIQRLGKTPDFGKLLEGELHNMCLRLQTE